jgi:N-acetylmuramoyl-L-alanine amidase
VGRLAVALALAVVVVVGGLVLLVPHRGKAGRVTTRRSLARPGSGSVTVGHDTGQPVDPALFADGSCVAFAPTAGDRHQTVFVDAGHGGVDPGAVGETESGRTIYEADETLPVELDVMALLVADGYRVVVSRTSASTVMRLGNGDVSGGSLTVKGAEDEIAARDVCANMTKANVLVGIYFDAGISPANAGSVTAYDTARPFASDNLRLATLLQSDVLAQLNAYGWGIPDDGAESDASLGGPPLTNAAAAYGHLMLLGPALAGSFSTPSEMPGALIEPLFITDPFEGTIAASAVGQEAIASGIADAVEQYLQAPAN